jgi:hypothetical protein
MVHQILYVMVWSAAPVFVKVAPAVVTDVGSCEAFTVGICGTEYPTVALELAGMTTVPARGDGDPGPAIEFARKYVPEITPKPAKANA